MFESLAAKASAFETKLVVYIIAGVVALVIVNLLLDGIRRYIRGLDTAALGALFIFLGYKATEFKLVSVLSNLLYLVGGTLFAIGILIFIIKTLVKRKRAVVRSGPPMPKEMPQKEDKAAEPDPAEPKHEESASTEPKHAAKK